MGLCVLHFSYAGLYKILPPPRSIIDPGGGEGKEKGKEIGKEIGREGRR